MEFENNIELLKYYLNLNEKYYVDFSYLNLRTFAYDDISGETFEVMNYDYNCYDVSFEEEELEKLYIIEKIELNIKNRAGYFLYIVYFLDEEYSYSGPLNDFSFFVDDYNLEPVINESSVDIDEKNKIINLKFYLDY